MAPCPIFCPRRQRLIEKFLKAVSEHHRLQTLQLESLVKGEGFRTHERQIAEARERRDRAKYAILAHEDSHGC